MTSVLTPPIVFTVLPVSEDRHIHFRTEEVDIDFNMTQRNGKGSVFGQVVSRSCSLLPSVLVHLVNETQRIQSRWTNYIGEFEFDNIPEGKLILEFEVPWTSLVDTGVMRDLAVARAYPKMAA